MLGGVSPRAAIGAGVRSPNPNAYEVFRCNDTTLPGRQNWTTLAGADGSARAKQLLADPFTAQTTLAASYGLLQLMYGRAIDGGWTASNGARNPSLLFDAIGGAARGEGSLVAGTIIVKNTLLQARSGLATPFLP